MSNPSPPKALVDIDHSETTADEMTARLLEQFKNLGSAVEQDSNNYINRVNALPAHLQTDSENPSVMADVLHIASFEDEFDRISREDIAKRNRCSVSEYIDQWLLLHCHFEHSGYTELNEFKRERARRSLLYFDRFSTQHPIVIFADHNPTEVVAVLPRQYNPSKLIQGNYANAIDQFISYGEHDRPDVKHSANTALLSATVRVNSLEVSQKQLMQAKTVDEIVKVLRYFNPEHPLVKKMDTQKQIVTNEQEQKTKETQTLKDSNIVDDLDLSDMGI